MNLGSRAGLLQYRKTVSCSDTLLSYAASLDEAIVHEKGVVVLAYQY
jgi:hypothetical protein